MDTKETDEKAPVLEAEPTLSFVSLLAKNAPTGAFSGWGPRMFTASLDVLKFKN